MDTINPTNTIITTSASLAVAYITQSRSGPSGEEKNSQPPPGNETPNNDNPVPSQP
jgi:hypothetical protein